VLGRRSAELVLDAGTCSILPAAVPAVELVERLDGRATLRGLGADARGVALCRELLGLGALKIVD